MSGALSKLALTTVAVFAAKTPCALGQPYDLHEIESRTHLLINKERKEKGASALSIDLRLAAVARAHTADMVQRGFYSHKNPDGRTAPERLAQAHPELVLLSVAENINLIEPVEPDRMSGEEVAERFVHSWMGSAGHRRSLLDPDFTHTGIALSIRGQRAIVTQVFAALLVEVLDPRLTGRGGISAAVPFRYLGVLPRKRLTGFVEFADSRARYFISNQIYYTGSAPLVPRWKSEDEFAVLVPCELGAGVYHLSFGFGNMQSGRSIAVECR